MIQLWSILEQKLEEMYRITPPEWVQVTISRHGKIHVTFVVNQKNIKEEDIRRFIHEQIADYPEDDYKVGFIRIFSCNEAERLEIKKQERNETGIYTWNDGLRAIKEEEPEIPGQKIISFYSYKGGVGRTIAMIQTAYNLAKEGKRVLMLDLDIEAPSLHNIFSEAVNDKGNGVRYGIVEYLYRKTVQKSKDENIQEIFCQLRQDSIPGEIFLIPACKQLNKEYIYQIGKIHTQKIREMDVFSEVFEVLKEELDLDMVLIDTRAGFNHWGSLSLLSLSDQVIFIAYPNRENVEGLNIAFEIMKNIGMKRYAVAMSKVVATEDGVKKARELFGELDIAQESLIPLYYRQEVALSSQYPMSGDEAVGAYRELSNYILDNETLQRNQEFLADGMKDRLLENLFKQQSEYVKLKDLRRFLDARRIYVLRYHVKEELKGIEENKDLFYALSENSMIPICQYTLYEEKLSEAQRSLLLRKQEDFEQLGMELVSECIANAGADLQSEVRMPKKGESREAFIEGLKQKITEKDEAFVRGMENQDEIYLVKRLLVILSLTDELLEADAGILIENIKGLIDTYNRSNTNIQFKFAVRRSSWVKYQKHFAAFKRSSIEIKVCRDDIEALILANINMEQFEDYREYFSFMNRHPLLGMRIDPLTEKFLLQNSYQQGIMDLILGTRKDVKLYSRPVMEYLADWMEDNPEKRYDTILDCLKRAAAREQEENDQQYSDRLISFRYLMEELRNV